MLTISCDISYVINEHEDLGQYGPYVMSSEMMSCYISSSVKQHEVPIELPR